MSSLVRDFLHYTQISPSFVHLNLIYILMGCSILNQLFNLELFLLEIIFIYTIKLNKWGKFIISTCRRQLQLITNLSDSRKGWAIKHVIVSREWEFATPDPRGPYPLNHTLKLPSKCPDTIYLFNICLMLLLDSWKLPRMPSRVGGKTLPGTAYQAIQHWFQATNFFFFYLPRPIFKVCSRTRTLSPLKFF